MGTEVIGTEFHMMKDTVWKLSSRVLLLEGFIKQQFGNVFWKFCEEQVKAESEDSAEDDMEGENNKATLPMPPMIPILNKKLVAATPKQKPIPPPPPLAVMPPSSKTTSLLPPPPSSTTNNSPQQPYQSKARHFLPKSLAPKPKLPSSITITPTNTFHHKGGNGITGISILKDKISSSEGTNEVKVRKSAGAISKQTLRLSTGSASSIKPNIQLIPTQQHLVDNNLQDYQDYYQGESEEGSEGEDTGEFYGGDGFLAAELVSATLCTPDEEEGDVDEMSHSKKMRLSLGACSSSSSSLLNGTGQRQMRPNPCHARCQNRCHDIWTDGDRMGVFQTYWAIATEEERREFVASRIERVDMATKRTEFSNFRTCTFKYYLPHPDNPWVQVCKNFFLATIDEKRSYIEKIAQSVKGDTEKVSAKNIPFRRRNQMQRVNDLNAENYMGWMSGLGLGVDVGEIEEQDLQEGGQPYDQDDSEGMEMMEEVSQD